MIVCCDEPAVLSVVKAHAAVSGLCCWHGFVWLLYVCGCMCSLIQDGRLHINDQLVKVNGDSLLGVSNMVAMDTLRRAMQKEGSSSEHIHLVVARRMLPRDVRISASDATDVMAATSAAAAKDNKHTSHVAVTKKLDKNANRDNYMDLNSMDQHDGHVSSPRQRSVDTGYHNHLQTDGGVTLVDHLHFVNVSSLLGCRV